MGDFFFKCRNSLLERRDTLLGAGKRLDLGVEFFAVDGRQLGNAIAQLPLDLFPQIARRLAPGLQQTGQPPADFPEKIPIPHPKHPAPAELNPSTANARFCHSKHVLKIPVRPTGTARRHFPVPQGLAPRVERLGVRLV
ncbi:MAG: hypothetical protein OXF82_07880, partial [Gammaproteobacteria bacterium]|nr:hypothetical protein [Gammaproteobacteria bacterium]